MATRLCCLKRRRMLQHLAPARLSPSQHRLGAALAQICVALVPCADPKHPLRLHPTIRTPVQMIGTGLHVPGRVSTSSQLESVCQRRPYPVHSKQVHDLYGYTHRAQP